jgi:hypothetical protein
VTAKRVTPPITATATAALTNDVSVPYDASARLAKAIQTSSGVPYKQSKVLFEAQAIPDMMAEASHH